MGDGTKDIPAVAGVNLLSDGSGEVVSNLGVVIVPPESSTHLPVTRLRQLIKEQISCCPPSFRFCSQGKWPISVSQEKSLTFKNVISHDGSVSIQQMHNKPKIGIKARTGIGLGFVFADSSLTLADLRSSVSREVTLLHGLQERYHFLDANSWPVARHMERSTHVSEVLRASCVTVGSDALPKPGDGTDETDGNWLRHLSFNSSKDTERQDSLAITPSPPVTIPHAAITNTVSSPDKSKKQLLISYVRAEAAEYALHLKIKLAEFGYSVYLDVHEICVGVDWQDSLNFAVSNCEVFIPLVTPRYGETLWTNREVKLADVLGKYILPVNFLPEWPPRCLAIQFATTQFVLCGRSHVVTNGKSEGADRPVQMAHWDLEDVSTAAAEITKKLRRLSKSGTMTSAPSLKRMKTLRKTFVGKLPAMPRTMSGADGDVPLCKTKHVLVCLHPAQTEFGQELKAWLEGRTTESYSVWLSCETELPACEFDTLPMPFSQYSKAHTAVKVPHFQEYI
ncbi:hypothetical protein BaRGS_00032282 [Batillaria attramentaria]|uniref:TIR domain-containing protein n=1 Tax=Batillaria attramentaria TaxID=370345 RepID=A0ABD0JPP0_9CAEN